jgi:YesN/AraC family two-component response regulator
MTALTNLLDFNNDLHLAGNGQEALDLFLSDRYDVVVTDIKMPKMNGLDLLREIRKYDNNVRVIVVTGHSDEDNEAIARGYGVDGFFSKPLDVRRFMSVLSEIECSIR